MDITLQKSLPKRIKCLTIPFFAEEKNGLKHLSKSLQQLIAIHLKENSLEKKEGSSLITHSYSENTMVTIVLFSLGEAKELNHKTIRNQAATLTKLIKAQKKEEATILIPPELMDFLQPFVEGVTLANYHPAIHKTGDARKEILKSGIKQTFLVNPKGTKQHEHIIKEVTIISNAIKTTRDFVNNPPNIVSTVTFVREARDIAKQNGYKITVFDKKKIEQLKMGALLAVNAGSKHPASFVILEHNATSKEKPIILVGKGLIFDTGGINLKPSGHIEDMQLDMAGGALVLGVFRVLKKLGIKRHVIGMVPVTDNAIGPDAIMPSEIVRAYDGKTIEIGNTDAEGRLILADALSYAIDKYSPQYLIDFATLTGACMIALGNHYAGLFGQDKELLQKIMDASEATDEGTTILPISDADKEAVKGQIADLTNNPAIRYAGAGKAAAFLQHFVGKSKWAHVDIAGTAWSDEPKPYEAKFATGWGIRLMVEFLRSLE